MKQFLSLCIISTAAALLWQGCVKDNGMYDYRDINEIMIGNIPDTVDITQGYRLTITPNLASSLEKDETHYVYRWIAHRFEPPVGGQVSYVLDSTRNLNNIISLPVDDYMVNYRVTDTSTGVFFEKRFRLSVKTLVTRGYLVMSDVDGWMRLSMLSRFGNVYTLYPDILNAIGCELPPQEGPIKVLRFHDMVYSPGNYALYLLTRSGTNRIHDETFKYHPTDQTRPRDLYSVRYHFMPPEIAPDNFIASNMHTEDGSSVLLHGMANSGASSGKKSLFNRYRALAVWWSVPVNILTDSVDFFNASEKLVHIDFTNGWLVFDEDTRSFYQLRTQASRCNLIRPEGVRLPWRRTGMDLVYGGSSEASSFLILRNVSNPNYSVGDYIFIQVERSFTQSNLKVINAEDIDKAELFAIGGPYNAQEIYYAVGGKVYRWNIEENLWWKELDFGSDKVTYLGFVPQAIPYAISKSDYIYVGSYNEASKQGTLSRYDIPQREVATLQKMDEWTNFGKIVSVTLK